MGESRLDGLPFWSQESSSETTTCNTPIFLAWEIRSWWLRAFFSLSILRGRREILKQCQSSQNSHADGPFDTACIG